MPFSPTILIINAGSSSIRFAVYELSELPIKKLSGKITRIGLQDARFTINESDSGDYEIQGAGATSFDIATHYLLDWIRNKNWFPSVKAIGHRIVHGMSHTQDSIIDESLLNELNGIRSFDPDHLPAEIEIIQVIKQKYPGLLQVACFDTAFHTTIPAWAKKFAIPDRYYKQGVMRYGFHGISYRYLMRTLKEIKESCENGRVVLAHLGNGASMAAIHQGKCIDTTMGFTPAGGLIMSTRSGDLDPGVTGFMMESTGDEKIVTDQINHHSGLLGISGISGDMEDLLACENKNENAALAIKMFCYQAKKQIGAYTAVLGGIDTLVFTGGIGENSSIIRSRICKNLHYLGIELDEIRNKQNAIEISTSKSLVKIFVIPANEELMIAESTARIYGRNQESSTLK